MLQAIKKLSLTRQMVLGAFAVITMVMAIFLAVTASQTRTMMVNFASQLQQQKTEALAAELNIAHQNITKSTELLASVFHGLYPGHIRLSSENSVLVGSVNAPLMTHNGEQLNLNFEKVDLFSRMTGGNATLFARHHDDFIRVTTSLKNQHGERVIGTYLGKKHPGYALIMRGESYLGSAKLFGTEYMTKYSPIIDENGEVVGISYVGLPVSDVMASIRSNLAEVQIGESGYIALMDSKGNFIEHKGTEGESAEEIYGAALNEQLHSLLNDRQGSLEFVEPATGRRARLYFEESGMGDWKLILVSYEYELINKVTQLIWLLAQLSLLATLALVVLLSIFMRLQLKPMAMIGELMQRVGEGDLTARFEQNFSLDSKNELDQLKFSVNAMLQQFGEIISQVRNVGDLIASASVDIANSSGEMKSVAHNSSQEASQVSSAVNEMAHTIEHVSANTTDVTEETNATAKLSEQGNNAMLNMVEVVERLQHALNEASERASALTLDSEAIGGVVDVISSVAEQTNLLALNAAIEAARAGEHGRGFSVVAEEVRTLAQRTQQSTGEILQVVQKLQQNSSLVTDQINIGVVQMRTCVDETQNTNQILAQIRQAAADVKERMENIASSTVQQSAAATQISQSFCKLEQSAQLTATRAEGAADAGTQISDYAQKLCQQVSRFSV